MGAKASKSKPICNECDCQSEVPRVIAACKEAGDTAVSSSLNQSITSLIGEQNAESVIKNLNEALGSNTSKWVTDFNKIKATFNNDELVIVEQFIEGNDECVPCNCEEAADEIIADCKKYVQEVPATLKSHLEDDDMKNFFAGSLAAVNGPPSNNSWELIYPSIKIEQENSIKIEQENTNNKEGFKEGFDDQGFILNGGLYNFTRTALASRHEKFKAYASFDTDCRTNSYTSIKTFLIKEKAILDSLYKYYLTFVKDYESLYLHRESFTKAINNKLDELKKIQEKLDSYKTNVHLDNRKNLYQSNNYEFYSKIRFYMLIVYYSVIVLYLIFSKFFAEKQYTNKFLVLLLFIYLIIPIILENIINLVYKGYIYFLEYNNLKEDAKSYEDIINKT